MRVKVLMDGLRGRGDCDDPRGDHLTHPALDQSRSAQGEYVEVKCCLCIYRWYFPLWSSFNRKQLTNKHEDKTATKMFKMFSVTLFLVLSISMLTQSAPAADPEPQECQPIKEPYTHCALKCSECEPDCITLFREVYPC